MEGKGPKVPGCKVVLLGDSGVGKTCIISRYIQGTFEKNCTSTNGASYCSKNVRFENFGKNLLLDIWDTAGQEKYKSLTKFFYKDAAVAILVYDVTQKESFENMKGYWFQQLQEFGSKDLILGVAGNKCDMYEKEEVNENDAKQFAESIGAFFQITSAKNNTGIQDLFMDAANRFVNPDFKGSSDSKDNQEASKTVKLDNKDLKKDKKKGCC